MAPLVKELDGVAQKYQNTGKNKGSRNIRSY